MGEPQRECVTVGRRDETKQKKKRSLSLSVSLSLFLSPFSYIDVETGVAKLCKPVGEANMELIEFNLLVEVRTNNTLEAHFK